MHELSYQLYLITLLNLTVRSLEYPAVCSAPDQQKFCFGHGSNVTRHGTLVLMLGLFHLQVVFVYGSRCRALNNFGCQVLSISILGFTKIIMFGYQLGLCLNM